MAENHRFFREIFTDADGCYSSKRTTVAIATVLFVVAFFADLMFDQTITQFIFDGVMWIILGGLGLTLGEKIPDVFKKLPGNIVGQVEKTAQSKKRPIETASE